MWAGKYKTTGHGSLIMGDEFGRHIVSIHRVFERRADVAWCLNL